MTHPIRPLADHELDAVGGGASEQEAGQRLVRTMWATYAAVMDIIDAAKAAPTQPCK